MAMRVFGAFKSGERSFFGEVLDNEIHVLSRPFWFGIEPTGEKISPHDVEICVPVSPSKVIAVGLNYAEHIAEMKRTPLGTPLIWFKAPSSLLPHQHEIEIAFPDHQIDFEVELAIVIGVRAKNVTVASANDFIFGYTIGEDISDRDLQKSEKQFGRCKSFDTYTPIGPFVYSNVDVADVEITLRQNGELKQHARTSQMIYSPAAIVSFSSQNLTLLPCDVILTGTPSGVGSIRPGDELEARISDWPPLRNRVRNAAA
jgi:2-keto-4-pentenoate hydratase/2-oxohepta-3-ene-1,7-dioic acid hydratase in catechol pathway